MSKPLVSICLPNLNNLPYLAERVDTILQQTYTNWELIVSDNYSDDGAWPFFERLAKDDARVRIAQAPRKGMYENWNCCIRRARGKYVYIATSDDTMATDCLEKLVDALERHPECDLAHCRLLAINADGTRRPNLWSRLSMFAKSSGDLFPRMHIRRAPYDGLLHVIGEIVYLSITQLLIRRSLFTKIGLFESRWGSIGDFNWEMRAGLVANTVHVPETWGGFRVHEKQATARVEFESREHLAKIEEMIDDALVRSQGMMRVEVNRNSAPTWWKDAYEHRRITAGLADCRSAFRRKMFLLREILRGSRMAGSHVCSRLFGHPRPPYVEPRRVQKWLSGLGMPSVLPAAEGSLVKEAN